MRFRANRLLSSLGLFCLASASWGCFDWRASFFPRSSSSFPPLSARLFILHRSQRSLLHNIWLCRLRGFYVAKKEGKRFLDVSPHPSDWLTAFQRLRGSFSLHRKSKLKRLNR